MQKNWQDVISFWKQAGPKKWFAKDDGFDQEMRQQFMPLLEQAIEGQLDHWKENADACLGLILILDQFSRNLFRNNPKAFSQDPAALSAARHALEQGYELKVDPELRSFIYMPLMHSEALEDQKESLRLQTLGGKEANIKAAKEHFQIIERFGRFPHRNQILGRQTTPEEEKYLQSGGFKG